MAVLVCAQLGLNKLVTKLVQTVTLTCYVRYQFVL